jgi:hypothetical protein
VSGTARGPPRFQLGVGGTLVAAVEQSAGELVDGHPVAEDRDGDLAIAQRLPFAELLLPLLLLALLLLLLTPAILDGLHLCGVVDGSACHGCLLWSWRQEAAPAACE